MFSQFRSGILLIAAAALSIPALQAQTPAPAKVAIINAQKAVADTQEIQKAVSIMEAKYKPRQQTIESLQKELQGIQQQANAPNVPPDREAQLQADFTTKQKQLQRLGEDLQADVNAERQDILGRAGRNMSEVVKKLAEERGLDVVIDISNTIYFRPALDITPAATEAYNKAYPAK
jgi:outer membrane protein